MPKFDRWLNAGNPFGFYELPNIASTVTLNSAYTHDSAGVAIASIFKAPRAGTLDEFYIYIVSTATPGTIIIEVREVNGNFSSSSARPEALLATETISPGDVTGVWHKVTLSTPPTLVLGKAYSVVVGTGTGEYTVQRASRSFNNARSQNTVICTTTSGYSSSANTSTLNLTPAFVYVMNAGTANELTFGNSPVGSDGSFFSGTNERGLYISEITRNIVIGGVFYNGTGSANIGSVRLYHGDTAPNGTPILEQAHSTGDNLLKQFRFPGTVLEAGEHYRISLIPTSASGTPEVLVIPGGDTHKTVLRKAAPAEGKWHATQVVSNAWVNYPDLFPRMIPLLSTPAGDFPNGGNGNGNGGEPPGPPPGPVIIPGLNLTLWIKT